MLDLTKDIEVQYVSGGLKTATVRWPTDSEWCERNRRHRIVTRQLGRNKSQSSGIGLNEANAALLEKIFKAGEPVEDAADATAIITRLETLRFVESQVEGNTVRVTMRAMGCTLEHILKMPTAKRREDYEAASMSIVTVKGGREYRQQLEPAGDLYNELCVSNSGYASPVPIVHKDAALSALLSEMDALLGDDEGE